MVNDSQSTAPNQMPDSKQKKTAFRRSKSREETPKEGIYSQKTVGKKLLLHCTIVKHYIALQNI